MELMQQNFGAEIEMTAITRKEAANVVASFFGSTATYMGGVYDAWEIRDSQGRKWRVMSDSSITAMCRNGKRLEYTGDGSYKAELVTPILNGVADIENLQEVIRALRAAKAVSSPDYKCGIHVHVDAANHNHSSLTNLVYIMASAQDILTDVLEIAPERRCYCQHIDGNLLDRLNQRRPRSMDELMNAWYDEQGYGAYARHEHYNGTRYRMLNLHAVWFRGTVEFRCFNGTLHAGKVKSYIQFCLGLSAQAINHRSPKASQRKKMTLFGLQDFIYRAMGLQGDEFKTMRYWMGGTGYKKERRAAAKRLAS